MTGDPPLPPCAIDVDACPKFSRLVKHLKKKHRRIVDDLERVFEDVARDYETAAHATAIVGWKGEVWKHRCASTDMQKGQSGGFRIVSWVDKTQDPHVLYPLLIYPKSDKEDAAVIEIAEAIRLLKSELESRSRDDVLLPGEDPETTL